MNQGPSGLNSGKIISFVVVIVCVLSTIWYTMSYIGTETQNMYDNIYICIGSFISALGTVFLGYISISQSNKSYELSEELAQLTQTEYLPVFSITRIEAKKYENCQKNDTDALTLNTSYVTSTPRKCSSYMISLKNEGYLPITQITVSHDKLDKRYYKNAKADLYLARNESIQIDVCTVGQFDNNELVIKAENIAGYEFSLKITLKIEEDVVTGYFCKMC